MDMYCRERILVVIEEGWNMESGLEID